MSTITLAAWLAWSCLVAGGGAAATTQTTLGDLQIAYNIECNAEQCYQEYANQADREGFHKVASLLRAAARGEQVHAAGHAAAIDRLGAKPTATIEPVPVRSLGASLTAAIAEETYERDHMYKLFSRTARDLQCDDAQASFDRAREAESTHAALLRVALDNLDHMKIAQSFYVCPRCGSVTTEPEGDECLGCGAPVTAFVLVN